MVIKSLISRIKEKQNKKEKKRLEKKRKRKREICPLIAKLSLELKGKMAHWKLACGKQTFFFSAGEKRAEKRVCSPQANWKRAVINFVPAKRSSRGSYIKTRNLIPCYACVAQLLFGCLWPNIVSLRRRKTKWQKDLPEGIA